MLTFKEYFPIINRQQPDSVQNLPYLSRGSFSGYVAPKRSAGGLILLNFFFKNLLTWSVRGVA
jgi:hypothetical protein